MSDTKPFVKQKIFLSYAHKIDGNPDCTADLVDAIQQRLTEAGHEAWIDRQQLHPGRDWREGITRGIDESDRVLSFLSPRAIRDPGVCLDEIGIAMSHKHGAIATLLADSDVESRIPASVAHVQYLDVTAWKALRQRGEPGWSAWLDETTQKILEIIAANSGFAGEIDSLKRQLMPMPDVAKLGKLIEHGLVGRIWVKDAIADWRVNRLSQRMFWLMGAPGMGKSAIAADLVHKAKLQVVAYHFCDYQIPESRKAHTFATNLAFMLAARLPDYRRLLTGNMQAWSKPVTEMAATEVMERLVVNPLRNKIDGGLRSDRLLVVVDALDEAEPELAELLAKYLDAMPGWLGFVVTSRPEVKAALARYPAFELQMNDTRNEQDLRAYLNNWHDNDPIADLGPATQSALIAASQGNMLYLALAKEGYQNGVFCLDRPESLPQGVGAVYLEWMRRQFGSDPFANPVWTERCYPLLELLCATPEPLPQTIAGSTLQWKGQDRILALRPLGSLITLDGDVFRLCHRSLGEWLSDPERLDDYWVNLPDGRFNLVTNLLASINTVLENDTPRYIHRALPILLAQMDAEQATKLLQTDHEITLARIESLNGFWEDYPNAYAWQLQAALLSWLVEQRERCQGANHLDTLTSLFRLGKVRYLQGEYAHALTQFERAYRSRLSDLGPLHMDTLSAMSCLALSLYAVGKYADAEKLQEQELSLHETVSAPDSPSVLSARSNLARTLYARGQYATSKALHAQVLDIQRETLGDAHASTIASISHLASALYAMGDCEEAAALNEKAVAVRTTLFGPEHPFTLTSASYLATALYSLGEFERAKSMYEHILMVRRRVLGDLHADTLASHGNLALAIRALGGLAEAKSIQQEVILQMSATLGANRPSTLFQQSFFADTLFDLEEYDEACATQETVLAARSAILGQRHPDSLTAAANLALTRSATGDHEAAKILLEQVVDAIRSVLGEKHPDTIFTERLLARVLQLCVDESASAAIFQRLEAFDANILAKRPVHYTNSLIFEKTLLPRRSA